MFDGPSWRRGGVLRLAQLLDEAVEPVHLADDDVGGVDLRRDR